MLKELRDGRTDKVFDYLAAGHAANTKDENGTSLIGWCAYHGDVSAMRLLLQHGESLQSLGENLGLHGAAFHGHWQLCQFLIEAGADVNRQLADTGESPLHAAVCKANRPVFEHVLAVLLAAGADPNLTTKPDVDTGSFIKFLQPVVYPRAILDEVTITIEFDIKSLTLDLHLELKLVGCLPKFGFSCWSFHQHCKSAGVGIVENANLPTGLGSLLKTTFQCRLVAPVKKLEMVIGVL